MYQNYKYLMLTLKMYFYYILVKVFHYIFQLGHKTHNHYKDDIFIQYFYQNPNIKTHVQLNLLFYLIIQNFQHIHMFFLLLIFITLSLLTSFLLFLFFYFLFFSRCLSTFYGHLLREHSPID